MGIGLLSGYGMFAAIAARFLFPSRPSPTAWLFATEVDRLPPGQATSYVTPVGEAVLITRHGEGVEPADFVALSSTCPHLGCKVHWEGQHERFFCPCHNGTFDPKGKPTGGPPQAAGQGLPRYALKVENGLLFINVPLRTLPIGPPRQAS
jgi:Rieske Fe-S protein